MHCGESKVRPRNPAWKLWKYLAMERGKHRQDDETQIEYHNKGLARCMDPDASGARQPSPGEQSHTHSHLK
jgi:hypothetical protein